MKKVNRSQVEGKNIDGRRVNQHSSKIQDVVKKDWFKPTSTSMAQLEQVKTTIYNLGLHDPRELRATKGRTLAAAPHNTFRDLCTEPPLSSISYQHTAWGSNSSIPEMIKKFGETGARLGRPSSAKTTSVNHPPRKLKIRPQSAKDPLCPNGKKTLPIGVKGNHFEPGERLAKDILPHAFISGWADAPAGFHLDFSQDQADEKLDATGDAHNKHSSQSSFLPSTPASSPRQLDDYSPSPSEKDEEKKTSSFGISLSLYMPSAEDNENTDEPDTGRLLKKADSFVEDHRKRSAAKIKLFTANADITPGKTSEKHVEKTFVQTGTGTNFVPPEITDNRVSFEKVQDVLVFEDSKTNTNEVDSHLHTVIREQEERAWDDQTALDNSKTCILTEEMLINDFETEKKAYLATGDYETLSTKDAHELEYLGPQKNDRKPKIHPIFLESESMSKAHMDQEKSAQLDKNTATGSRTVVQICEEKNVMVDITPRNLGRKLPDKSLYRKILQRKHQGDDGQTAENMSDKSSHLPGQRSESEPTLEIMATRVKNNRMMDARLGNPAPTITVVYDDGDNDESRRISNIRSSDKVKKQRQKGVKEKDIVTMVSEVGPDSVEDIKKDSCGNGDPFVDASGVSQMISMSSEEKNYYEIGRKHCKSEVKGQDEKNFITMTTKTILFDAEQPRESVVKHTINVPLLKKREKLPSTPASYIASHPKSEKHENSLKNVTETPTVSSPGDQISSQMNSACCDSPEESKDARPSSRLGFVAVESDADNQESAIANTEKQHVAVNQRPPSGKRQLKSSDKKAPNTDLQNTPSCPTSKGSRVSRRPLSASAAIGQPPSGADARRASEAAKALRQAKEEACQHQTAAASRFQETRRHYGSYGSSRPPTGHQKNAMSYTGHQIVLKSKMPDDEFETETSMECREMQKRLACYGIDVKAETLERALFPPSGKTLYYEVTAKLPQSNSDRLLSHPRFWLPEEHKRLRLAEKKLALAELSLWYQRKEEERKAKLAAQKEKGKNVKNKKKKGKKMLGRSQSMC